ncbi:MHYT domain-containing protein [Pseudogemmobacter sp. W21_MBD1_M6]|uniref:MHYT domain-containing protein n=1 Tax=Pseudogemmobacter sp. W21_MBD1_M6 TaxID=3240271 RepID=UPI003F9962BC
MLDYSHSIPLVLASLAVSLMASFTGLALTQGLSRLPETQRKLRVAMASVALGGGIWSMHFVAMLGLQLPILFYYDTLTTLISALVAILMVGVAFLVMHFRTRTSASICIAGTIVGLGIPAMHYIGMSGMQLCTPVYTPIGIVLAVAASVVLGIGSFGIAYGARTHRNIILSTLTFGLAVFAVHFLAMADTNFVPAAGLGESVDAIDNAALAIIVTLISFVICGAFLLSGVTFWPAAGAASPDSAPARPASPVAPGKPSGGAGSVPVEKGPVPYEKDGRTLFVDLAQISAIRAEGHYTILYSGPAKLFCQWSITDAETRLKDSAFIRCHRSYMINPRHVSGFERKKDNGICYFERSPQLGAVPVSRTRLAEVRQALGL